MDIVSLKPLNLNNEPYELAVHNKTKLPVIGFGKNPYAVYKEPGGNVFRTQEPGTEEMLIGNAFKRKGKEIYNKEDVHRVFIHPNKRYLYFGAQKENRTAIGRYDIHTHNWKSRPIKGKIKQFVLGKDDILWCLTEADELYGFESESTEFGLRIHKSDVTAVASHDKTIVIVQSGAVKQQKEQIFETLAYNNRIEENDINVQQVALNSQYIFIGTRDSLWKYDIKLHKWTPFKKAKGFYPKYDSLLQSGLRIYTDIIILSDNSLIVLDSDGNLFILDAKNMLQSEPVDTGVIKFQIVSSNLYYLKSDGLYELSDFKNNLLSSRLEKRLFASNKSKIGYITYVKETSNALYFGSREGIVQKYLPDTHEWGKWLKFKSPIKRIDVSDDRLIVETMSNQLFIENEEVTNNYIDWFAESKYIWILKKDGLYRFDMNLLKTDQILGKGKACFSRLNRIIQCVKSDENIFFLSKDGSLCSYHTELNQWENYPKVAKKKRLPFEIKGYGKRRAFLTESGYIQFTDATPQINTKSHASGMSSGQQVLNFELTDKDTFVLMSDRMLYQCPHNRSGANRCFPVPVIKKQYIPHNDLNMVLEKPIERSDDSIFITGKNILLYDKSFRIWKNYSLDKKISGYIKLSRKKLNLDHHYFLISGYLYRFEPSSVPSAFSGFESAFIASTSPNLTDAVKLKSIHCSKDTIIGLTLGKKLAGIAKRGKGFVKAFDTALQKYLLKYFQQKTSEQSIGYTISNFHITSSNEWLLVLDIPSRNKQLKLGYQPDRSPQFEKKDNIKFPKYKPTRIDNEIKGIRTSRGIRRKEDKLLEITVDDQNRLLYRMKESAYSQETVYALLSAAPEILEQSEFKSAKSKWKNRRITETEDIIIDRSNDKVKITDTYYAKLERNEWTHDRYYSMKKIGNKLYIENDAGIFQYRINSVSSALAFGKAISDREKFISQPHISEVLEWDNNRLARKDRFNWVQNIEINGRKLLIHKDKGKLKIKYDIKPEKKNIWNKGFEWDRIQDFGIDSKNRLWVGHPNSVMVYDLKNKKKLLSWFDQKNGVSDIMFLNGKGYFKASDKYYQLTGKLNDEWKDNDNTNGNIYQTLQTYLADNGIWEFKKENDQLQTFFRKQKIQFQQNGKFGIDQVNDLLYVQDNQSLIWATDEGIYDSTRKILHYFKEQPHVKINKLRYHPVKSSANKRKIIIWKDSIPYEYDPLTYETSQVSEKEQQELDTILSESDNEQWKFRRKDDKWKYDKHDITFKNGRFGFDTINQLLGDPIIFLTDDGIWEYQNDEDMKNWLSGKKFHKQGQRIFTSRYNQDKIYLETRQKQLFVKNGNQFMGPMSSENREWVYRRENDILTDKKYNKWKFPLTSRQDRYHFMYIDNNETYDVTFTNQRFGWNNVHDLEWIDNELHLLTTDGLVRWQFTEKGEWSLTQSLKDMKRIFRNRIDSSVFTCKNEFCSGTGFKWDGNQYQPIDNVSARWNDSESTLLEQGYGKDWEFYRGNDKKSVQIRYKDHTGEYRPVTLKQGRFGFNQMRLISANPEQVLMITQESQELFDKEGNSIKFELTNKVENYVDILNNIFHPEHWWIKIKNGYLWSKDGFDWKKGNNKNSTWITDQFEGKILTDKNYPDWEFRSDKGLSRNVSGHDIRFAIQKGKMSFDDMLAPTKRENTIATDGKHVWYVTNNGNGICMDNEGKILCDFNPEETNYHFNHIYFKNWQKGLKALLAETESDSVKTTRKWENKRWIVDNNIEQSYTNFRKVLLKNDNWEVIQSNKIPNVKVLPINSKTYVPLTLSKSSGFLADRINAVFPYENSLQLATDEGIRILDLNKPGWDMHTYIKGEKQSVQDVRFIDNRRWARFDEGIYCSDQLNRWMPENECKSHSPFADPQFSADNWEWYLNWNNSKGRYVLKLLSVKNKKIEREFDSTGNFSDNLVHDFDASGDKICISSKFGVSLYDTEGNTVALYPKLSNAKVLHQKNWFFKYKNKAYMLPDNPIYPQDQPVAVKNNPFQKQILTSGWGRWYKDEDNTFSFELCNIPLKIPIFNKTGKFSFDILPKIFVLTDQLWAAIPSGIIQYDLSDPLVIRKYFPCSLGNGDIQAVSLKESLYFVDKKYILDVNTGECHSIKTFKNNNDLWEKINNNIQDQAIFSKDRLWKWERTDNGLVVRYNENPEWIRTYSKGRFQDDQPRALYTLDKLLCYECPVGYYILYKNTLLIKDFKKSRPKRFKDIEPITDYKKLELRNGSHKCVYLNDEPYAPENDKLWTLIPRHDDFYALGDRCFYQIHLPPAFNNKRFWSLN
ncbi:MAG: hypothetical protein GY795_41470 [Desulfobacterales bacterium]|nr:hypothetical protein [Desulfobacterales bacterium]